MSRIILMLFVLTLLASCREQPQGEVAICPKSCEISLTGLTLIRQFEGFVPYIYSDAGGKKTIGYGHLIQDNESFNYVTLKQAEELLKQDVQEAAKAVKRLVTIPVTQGQYDALISFTFNLGSNRLRTSKLLRLLNSGEYAGDEFKRWVHVNKKPLDGLISRRNAELVLFNS